MAVKKPWYYGMHVGKCWLRLDKRWYVVSAGTKTDERVRWRVELKFFKNATKPWPARVIIIRHTILYVIAPNSDRYTALVVVDHRKIAGGKAITWTPASKILAREDFEDVLNEPYVASLVKRLEAKPVDWDHLRYIYNGRPDMLAYAAAYHFKKSGIEMI